MKYLGAVILATGAFAQPWHPYAAYPDGLTPHFGQGLWDNSIWTQHTVTQWPSGAVPASCILEMGKRGCAANHIFVYNVTYTDCPRPWVFCRCDNAPVHIGRTADIFGRLPVKLRSRIRHPQIVPHTDGSCGGGAPDDGDLLIAGDCPLEVFIHEAGHLVDNRGDVFGEDYSSKPDFINAMNSDTCSVSYYARENGRHEVFAEISVVTLYYLRTGTLPAVVPPATTGCYNNQLQTIVNRFGSLLFTYGGTCGARADDSPSTPVTKRIKRDSKKAGPHCDDNI
ncbi:hypothetical protein ABW19_dt0206669 [Dactylella cylindrospora]|nr:hypothetical protein ABW19_dt0206669 [Dactylella cylindrospora]